MVSKMPWTGTWVARVVMEGVSSHSLTGISIKCTLDSILFIPFSIIFRSPSTSICRHSCVAFQVYGGCAALNSGYAMLPASILSVLLQKSGSECTIYFATQILVWKESFCKAISTAYFILSSLFIGHGLTFSKLEHFQATRNFKTYLG